MTKRQRAIIEDIKSKLGIKYEGIEGPTLADRFIKKHIASLRQYNTEHDIPPHPNHKQAIMIKAIEKDKRVKFTGTTAKEASEFIEKYYTYATFDSLKRVYF
jgi:hypothetical protein